MSCKPSGFLAFNIADLVAHGFIHPTLSRERPAGSIPQTQIDNPPTGVRFEVQPDGIITETRRQLPASAISMQVVFRKLMKTGADILGSTQEGAGARDTVSLLGAGGGAVLGTAIINTTVLGGTTAGHNDFALHILDAEMKINLPHVLTKDEVQTGLVELNGYPLSIFTVNPHDPIIFSPEELERIGNPEGLSGIRGNTRPDTGQFRLDRTELQFEAPGNIFEEIPQDVRKLTFRADNPSASGERHMPFFSRTENDVTEKRIQINTTGLREGDKIYITANIANNRRIRHLIRHRGDVAETSARGIRRGISNVFGFGFAVDAWNYRLRKWFVPADVNTDKVFKGVFTFPDVGDPPPESSRFVDKIEGWRLSEVISTRTAEIWAADSRGIISIDFSNFTSRIIVEKKDIRDQAWFDQFLQDNNLENKVFDGEDISESDQTGALFDLNVKTNSLLFDNEKLPYHRPFALALKSVSKFDAQVSNSGIGQALLDLEDNGVITFDERPDLFDLSFAEFEETPMQSIFPSAYAGFACGGPDPTEVINNGAWFDPRDPANRFAVFVPLPRGDLLSDWLLETPFFFDNFNKKTRIYTEYFTGEMGDGSVHKFSSIYALTLPKLEASISAGIDPTRDVAYLVFEDNEANNVLSYHQFNDYVLENFIGRIEVDASANHERPDFDHDKFKFVGFNRLLGDFPSYSSGISITHETTDICTGNLNEADLFSDIVLATDLSITTVPHDIAISPSLAIKKIVLEYSFLSGDVEKLKQEDMLASIVFIGNESVIDTIFVSVQTPNGATGAIIHRLVIDTRYYRGSGIRLFGDIWTKIKIKELRATVADLDKIGEFFLVSAQTSIAFDQIGRLAVFYADEDTENISVLLSSDNGKNWFRFKNILRLMQGEVASQPYVMDDKFGSRIKLFYVLNNSFLMVREVDLEHLECEDLKVEYKPPTAFDETSDDDLGLEDFTSAGKDLRKEPSYFICGDKDDPFLQKEDLIARKRRDEAVIVSVLFSVAQVVKSFRFIVKSDAARATLDAAFADARYAVFLDRNSTFYLFFVKDGLLNIKTARNFKEWQYIIKDVKFHINFEREQDDESILIENIQVLHDNESDILYVFYFHEEMLFTRKLQGSLLRLEDQDEDDKEAEEKIRRYLNITKESKNKPVFLVGSMSDKIRDAIKDKDPELLVEFCYPLEFADLFNEDFAVDVSTQPDGFFTKNLTRLFYQSESGSIHALTVRLDLPSSSETRSVVERRQCSENPKLDVQMKLVS